MLFALSIEGEIVDLESGAWSMPNGGKYSRNHKISDFLKTQNIVVSDANSAIDVAKLVEDISFTPGKVMYLKSNTNNFRIFDKRYYRSILSKELDWKHNVEKRKGYWKITQHYVGPPASIMMQPAWEIVTNQQDRLVEIRYQ